MKLLPFTLSAIAAGMIASAWASELESGIKLRLSGFGEGARDLGATPETPETPPAEETTAGTADLQWTLHWQINENWATYLRAQGFATTEEVVVTEEAQPRRTESYAALREFWFEYGGLTSYPGEVLRIGRQRVRELDGLWWDQDIESVRWLFDTTLLKAQLGVAESFSTYRTQDSDPTRTLRDRTYAFGSLGWQYHENHLFGLRAAHAFDDVDLEEEGLSGAPDAKLTDQDLTWLGLHFHSLDFYSSQDRPGFAYWLEGVYQFGSREDYVAATELTPAAIEDRDVRAWSADAGLRWRLPTAVPLSFGLAYAVGSGGRDAGESNRFEQTGLHSNRSRYTGTRSLLYRYGEALQPDIGNLQIASAFLAMPYERFDASLVYHRYRRDDTGDRINVDGVDLQPADGGRDLGDGFDLVMATYFGGFARAAIEDSDDLRSNLRLRGSLFRPDESYAVGPLDDQYRVMLELTLWF